MAGETVSDAEIADIELRAASTWSWPEERLLLTQERPRAHRQLRAISGLVVLLDAALHEEAISEQRTSLGIERIGAFDVGFWMMASHGEPRR